MTLGTSQENLNPGVFNTMEIKNAIDGMGKAFHELKSELPALVEQKAKGHIDTLLTSKFDKINEELNKLEGIKKDAEDAIRLAKRMANAKDALAETSETALEEKTAFRKFSRTKGSDKTEFHSEEIAKKALSMGSDPLGGILIRPYLDNTILQLMLEQTPFRQYAGSITISSDTYKQVASIDNSDTSWTDDESSPSDNQPNDYKQLEIMTGNLRVTVPVPENLINDAFFDLESSIMQQAARKFTKAESVTFFTGDGIKKPRGILTYPAADAWGSIEQIPSLSASALTYDGLMNLVYSLLSFYTKNAVFMMNRTTINQVRQLTTGTTIPVPMWQPSLIAGQPSTLSGFPVVYAPDMPTFAAGAKAIAFGDFSQGYLVVDRIGMTVLRDPFTRYPQILFRFLKRVGGGLRDYRAIKLQTISAS